MTENVMSTKTLPIFLNQLISTEKVQVHECDGEIRLVPIEESMGSIESPHTSMLEKSSLISELTTPAQRAAARFLDAAKKIREQGFTTEDEVAFEKLESGKYKLKFSDRGLG